MKIFVENYNGIFDIVKDDLEASGRLTDNPHEADAFLLWQDVRGDMQNLAAIAAHGLKKPVFVLQHGRGAMRDYGPPNSFTAIADKLLVWGESEKQRLLKYGTRESLIDVVGCPLFPRIVQRPKDRRGKNVLFAPVIAEKEEPENILVYAALKAWESEGLISTIQKYQDQMKKSWAWEHLDYRNVQLPDGTTEKRLFKKEVRHTLPRWLTYEAGLVNVKLSGVHDVFQYQAPAAVTKQNDPGLIDGLMELLANVDVLVCLEEGTMQLLACAMDIPVIVVDIFKYGRYGGCDNYDSVEKIKTKACYYTKNFRDVGRLVDHALKFPLELSRHRKEVCEFEGGLSLGDANANIIRSIESYLERSKSQPAAV